MNHLHSVCHEKNVFLPSDSSPFTLQPHSDDVLKAAVALTFLYKTSLFQTDKDMKFSVNSALLSQRLQTLGRVVSSKNSMPILGNFYFKLSDNVLTIIASDNEVYLSTNIELVSSEGELEFTINQIKPCNIIFTNGTVSSPLYEEEVEALRLALEDGTQVIRTIICSIPSG